MSVTRPNGSWGRATQLPSREETTWGRSRFSPSEDGTVPFRIWRVVSLRVASSGPSWGLGLVPAVVAAALGAVLAAQPGVPQAWAADDSPKSVSESPSDVKPTAEQSAAAARQHPAAGGAKASCCREWRVVRRRCRRRGLRFLCRCRPRRVCCYRVCGPEVCAPRAREAEKPDPYAWKDLFDGKTLTGWKAPEFGGEGKVYVKDGMIVMEMGCTMTGVTWTGDVPRDNYELEYEGTRLEGIDFFATVTFPVGQDHCSLVTGGWGGTVVGLSCIDYYDAGDNLTTRFRDFKDKQWYKFRVRVTAAKIAAWIDDEQVVDQERKGHEISIRMECDLCRPLGFATYCTTGAVRNIRIRKLKPAAGEQGPPEQK